MCLQKVLASIFDTVKRSTLFTARAKSAAGLLGTPVNRSDMPIEVRLMLGASDIIELLLARLRRVVSIRSRIWRWEFNHDGGPDLRCLLERSCSVTCVVFSEGPRISWCYMQKATSCTSQSARLRHEARGLSSELEGNMWNAESEIGKLTTEPLSYLPS